MIWPGFHIRSELEIIETVPSFSESSVLQAYVKAKDWEAVRKKASEIVDKNAVASAYNSAAWDLQEKNEELSMAAELSKFATEFTSAERSKPSGKKPRYLTAKQWNKDRESTYAMYADTYAMVLYKLNDFKNGFPFASEAAKVINKGEDASLNNTYALLTNKYSFHVLMDDENSVIGEYKVDGIPTKFVIDKSGKIRFKSIGFGGDERLIGELAAMIEMTAKEKVD